MRRSPKILWKSSLQGKGRDDNPNVARFLKNNQALAVINSINLYIASRNNWVKSVMASWKSRIWNHSITLCRPQIPFLSFCCCTDGSKENSSLQDITTPWDIHVDSPLVRSAHWICAYHSVLIILVYVQWVGRFVECMWAATHNKGFYLPSPQAKTDHFTACAVLNWAATNLPAVQHTQQPLEKGNPKLLQETTHN